MLYFPWAIWQAKKNKISPMHGLDSACSQIPPALCNNSVEENSAPDI